MNTKSTVESEIDTAALASETELKDFEATVRLVVSAKYHHQAVDLINYMLKTFCKDFEYTSGFGNGLPKEVKARASEKA